MSTNVWRAAEFHGEIISDLIHLLSQNVTADVNINNTEMSHTVMVKLRRLDGDNVSTHSDVTLDQGETFLGK